LLISSMTLSYKRPLARRVWPYHPPGVRNRGRVLALVT